MQSTSDLQQRAIKAWSMLLGADFVLDSGTEFNRYGKATFKTEQSIIAVLKLTDKSLVAPCLEISCQYKVPVYPISTGMNWGLGSSVPAVDGCVVLDLSQLNNIVNWNEDLGCITIQPGVTQQQIVDFLKEQKSQYFLGCTGSSPFSSVLGNVLERGDCSGANADRFANATDFEVVLPTGEIVKTGLSAYSNAKSAGLYKPGLGPSFDGLFSQSNFGVVTEATIWLAPKPPYQQLFLLQADNSQLPGLIDALYALKIKDIINSNITLVSGYKVMTTMCQLHEFRENYRDIEHWLQKNGCSDWNAVISLPCFSSSHQRAIRRLVKSHIKRYAKKYFFLTEARLKWIKTFSFMCKLFYHFDYQFFRTLYDGYGLPSERNLRAIYFRKSIEIPQSNLNPERDDCGIIWLCPCVPFRGEDIALAQNKIVEICHKYKIEPATVILGFQKRVVILALIIIYDRSVDGSDQHAMECHDELFSALNALGYFPNRLGIHSMGKMPKSQYSNEDFLRKLKSSIDPDGVLSPGRYIF